MSRIGNNPIAIPEGTTITVADGVVTVKGKLGELSQEFSDVEIQVADGEVQVTRPSDSKQHKAKQNDN